MKVLIAGANGYIGRHVKALFLESGHDVFTYSRSNTCQRATNGITAKNTVYKGGFDVVINCARPHWSEFTPEEIAEIEGELFTQLESFASESAIKIHTSGVWLFGKASSNDLNTFKLQPFDAVKPDVATIKHAIKSNWHVVYCPSLVYGGEECQLKRILTSLPNQALQVAVPSIGYNQYVHVEDIAQFYLSLVQSPIASTQHFIAETQGYDPESFSQLLLDAHLVKQVNKMSWKAFVEIHGDHGADVEKLNLSLPISAQFSSSRSIGQYIERLAKPES